MKYSELTDEKLIAIKTKVDKILEDRKNGKKRQVSDSEVIDIFKKNHDKFIEMHIRLGGEVFPRPNHEYPEKTRFAEYLEFMQVEHPEKIGFAEYLEFIQADNEPHSTVYYTVRAFFGHDGPGTGEYVDIIAESVFDDSAFHQEMWENRYHIHRTGCKWIVADGNTPTVEYVRELATKLGLI